MFINLTDVSSLLTFVGVLVIVVNIITQVVKKITWSYIPSSLLAFIVSQIVSVVALFVYCEINLIAVRWFYIVAAVFLGFLVSYAAMFGYDKLQEILYEIELENS